MITIHSITLEPTSSLKPYPQNYNVGDRAAIEESIRTNDFYGGVVCQLSSRYLIAGNHRRDAAEIVGVPFLPVCWVDVDDEAALRILVADNRTSELGGVDAKQLSVLLGRIWERSGSLLGTGYDDQTIDELQTLLTKAATPETVPGQGAAYKLVKVRVRPKDDQVFAAILDEAAGDTPEDRFHSLVLDAEL